MIRLSLKYVALICGTAIFAGCAASASTPKLNDLTTAVSRLDRDVAAGKTAQATRDLDAVSQVNVSCKDFKDAGPDAVGACLKSLLIRDRDGAITMYRAGRYSDSRAFVERFRSLTELLAMAKIGSSGGWHDALQYASQVNTEMAVLGQNLERRGFGQIPLDIDPVHT